MQFSLPFIVFVIILTASHSVISQSGLDTKTNFDQLEGASFAAIRQTDSRYEGVKGSPLLYDDFLNGIVQTRDSRIFSGLINYNALKDELWIKKNGQIVSLDPSIIISFKVDSSKMSGRFNQFIFIENNKIKGFYSILVKGKIPLLCKVSKRILKADYSGAYSSGSRFDEFLTSYMFYMRNGSEFLSQVKQSKNSLINIFQDRKNEIRNFISVNNLDVKNIESLITLFSFINSVEK